MVQRGQLLFTLDPRPAQAALAQAQAQVAQMQSQLTLARANLARSETLLASQAVSKAEYDSNKAAVDAAQANLAAANAAVPQCAAEPGLHARHGADLGPRVRPSRGSGQCHPPADRRPATS